MPTRALLLLLLCCSACEPSVVDAVESPAPVVLPEPESPLTSSLLHRYGFEGDGARIIDSKGAAHGEAVGVALSGNGELLLAGERSAQFAELPNGMISGLSSATIEAWLTWQGGGAWQRIFDFGNSSAGVGLPGATGTSYLFLTTQSADDATRNLPGALRAAYSQNGVNDEDICHGPAPFPIGPPTHVALVIEPASERMALYQDGQLLADCFLARPLSAIDDVNDWLGHSNFVADPDLNGSFDELRIYSAALTAAQLADSFAAGPDAMP
jgi:hypothetical protein